MAARIHNSENARRKIHAHVFAALGDETRLSLVSRLSLHSPQSISELSADSDMTRQAITKHLQILQDAGLIRSLRLGRQNLFEFNPQSLDKIKAYLNSISAQWDEALMRLKSFVEG